jgi:GT2 family glycosyltransferase
MNRYYGMVTTGISKKYTDHALSSFFEHTKLQDGDRFFLIVNDGEYDIKNYPVDVIKNDAPKSFAANVNQVLEKSYEDKKDIVFCNNDLIFTKNWSESLTKKRDAIYIANSNQYVNLYNKNFLFGNNVELDEYLKFKKDFEEVVDYYSKLDNKDFSILHPSFYCFFVPYEILAILGPFDEKFDRAGGEDIDYRLKGLLKGFETYISSNCYLLHFQGRSSWRSGEDYKSTLQNENRYREHFKNVWGQEVAKIFLHDHNYIHNLMIYDLYNYYKNNQFKKLLEECLKIQGEMDVRKRIKA